MQTEVFYSSRNKHRYEKILAMFHRDTLELFNRYNRSAGKNLIGTRDNLCYQRRKVIIFSIKESSIYACKNKRSDGERTSNLP